VLVIYRVYRYRRNLGSIFDQASTTKSRFFRLLGISTLIIFVTLPLSIHGAYYPYRHGLIPYSWKLVHSGWVVILEPTLGKFPHWDSILYAVSGYLVFGLFGLGQDAKSMYKGWMSASGLNKYFSSINSSTRSSIGSKLLSFSSKLPLMRSGVGMKKATDGSQ
jgi:pheromone a factor receptor